MVAVDALLALLITIGFFALFLGIIIGGVWVMDQIEEKIGEKKLDTIGAIISIIMALGLIALIWFLAFDALQDWRILR